ncbi:hypothetical protein LUZ61_013886 [Rhynchospora tenuis]|uniref:Uncharacterized protein n=1 Tax=Rhynchospora tenuis TaxID=198213 RepID=A0AAD5WA16_9POAL|nr:hypothetical protein LUZ61_013886 [Rhynchospora tenuis]
MWAPQLHHRRLLIFYSKRTLFIVNSKFFLLHNHTSHFSIHFSIHLLHNFIPSLNTTMDQFRSKSHADGRNMQLEVYGRSYSTPYFNSYEFGGDMMGSNKGKSKSFSSKKGWMNDPEFQRKKRVAQYKAFTVEGKVKGSFRKSFRWLKDRYHQLVYGWS